MVTETPSETLWTAPGLPEAPTPEKVEQVKFVHRGQFSPGWEVGMVTVEHKLRGQGITKQAYALAEKELGQKMKPSGMLLPDGYKMWMKRDPAAVAQHRLISGLDADYYSPKQLIKERARLRAIVRRKTTAARYETIPRGKGEQIAAQQKLDIKRIDKALSTIPDAYKRPSYLAKIFGLSGAGVVGLGATQPASDRSDAARKAMATRRAKGEFA